MILLPIDIQYKSNFSYVEAPRALDISPTTSSTSHLTQSSPGVTVHHVCTGLERIILLWLQQKPLTSTILNLLFFCPTLPPPPPPPPPHRDQQKRVYAILYVIWFGVIETLSYQVSYFGKMKKSKERKDNDNQSIPQDEVQIHYNSICMHININE